MAELITHEIKIRAGIDDLSDTGPGDQEASWWTEEDWNKWEAGRPERIAKDEKYIAELKSKGEFGNEYIQTFSFVPHPMFDDVSITDKLVSTSCLLINLH